MTNRRVFRYRDRDALTSAVAQRLLARLVELQSVQPLAQLCLCGGETALSVYRDLARLVPHSSVNPSRLELWWADESYTATDEGDRNAGRALGTLAGALHFDPARTHPMPARLESVDVADAALQYAEELGQTKFDITLLSMGVGGHVAAIFDNQVHAVSPVIGIPDAPIPPSERISVTVPTINRSSEVWVLASGEAKAPWVSRALSPDNELPASRVFGTRATSWFVDDEAGAELERYSCPW